MRGQKEPEGKRRAKGSEALRWRCGRECHRSEAGRRARARVGQQRGPGIEGKGGVRRWRWGQGGAG